jgi:hypothetical protein
MRTAGAVLATTALAAAVLTATATQAQARGDGWEKVPDAPPYTTTDCGTTITVITTVNKEWSRTTTDAAGNLVIQTTGTNKALVTTKDGRSARVNASGPSWQTLSTEGTYTYAGKGLNLFTLSPEDAMTLGLPQDALLSGPVTVRVGADGSLTLVQAPAHVRNVCDLLR